MRSYRRYAFLKWKAAAATDPEIASVWLGKRDAEPGVGFEPDFPARVKVERAGYAALEDVRGADAPELMRAGLSRREAQAVLAALE